MRPATHWDIPIKYWLQCLSVWITDSTLSVSVKLFHYYWLLILELIVIRSGAVVFDILLWFYCLFCSIADIIAIMFLKTFFVSDPEWQCFVTLWRVSHQNRIILILSIHESYQYTAETGALLDESISERMERNDCWGEQLHWCQGQSSSSPEIWATKTLESGAQPLLFEPELRVIKTEFWHWLLELGSSV